MSSRREQTRRDLLDAAAHVFARRGYHGASLDDIAARAGLTKGAVYYNFSSKEELFLTLLQERVEERVREVDEVVGSGLSVVGWSHRVTRGFMRRHERDPRWTPLFFEFVAFAVRDPRLRRAFGRHFILTGRRNLRKVIDHLREETGARPEMSTENLAIAINALTNGLILERAFAPVPDEVFGEAVELLMRGADGSLSGARHVTFS
jgi:AcrR family transcriptional regulator